MNRSCRRWPAAYSAGRLHLRLEHGRSFYAASNFVGWEEVVVGDPLWPPYLGRRFQMIAIASNCWTW